MGSKQDNEKRYKGIPTKSTFDGEHMPFGKHKGEPIDELEYAYLEWLVGNIDETSDVYAAVKAEYDARWARGVAF